MNCPRNSMPSYILLTVDVEDWFQVENLKSCVPLSSWDKQELRVERNTHRLLDLFDSGLPGATRANTQHKKISATFFVLGWIAQRLPHLVKEIHARGHEVASHGYSHTLCTNSPSEELKNDLARSKEYLEDILGTAIYGYRAPSFSANDTIMRIIRDCGYRYDSSFNSFNINKRYGKISLCCDQRQGVAYKLYDDFYELPVSNLKLGKYVFPWSGGGYFRVIPIRIFNKGVRTILKRDGAYIFYMHPWEIDHEQPRLKSLPLNLRTRHYINLKSTSHKLKVFLRSFAECSFLTCTEYLNKIDVPGKGGQ